MIEINYSESRRIAREGEFLFRYGLERITVSNLQTVLGDWRERGHDPNNARQVLNIPITDYIQEYLNERLETR